MDLSAFKAQVINDSAPEERVQVNQRHLIDKILARYSAPFTIYRELLQNANDAGATEARVRFISARGSPPASAATASTGDTPTSFDPQAACHAVVFENNGRPFQPEDWHRLKKIAEGNPDEQKIGFFGVGFYSLFSICEEPFVVSDKECMAFFWKGDQLFTKRLAVPEAQRTQGPWTTFSLDLREPVTLPDVEEFGRFLACSIAFTLNLRTVSLYLDDLLLVRLAKKVSDPHPLACTEPTGRSLTAAAQQRFRVTSPHGLLSLQAAEGRQVQLDGEYLKCTKSSGLFWSSAPKFSRTSSTLFLKVAQGHLACHASAQFAAQMERTTKKPPPTRTTVQMIHSGLEEYEASVCIQRDFPLFRDLLPSPGRQGRVFIGFPTHQTTGCSVHLAAHLIPTVERESIDFVDPHLARWNQEMLAMCALLARVLYDEELGEIGQRFTRLGAPPPAGGAEDPARAWLEKRCLHTLKSFLVEQATTPIATIGKIMDQGFATAGHQALPLLSSVGVLPCDRIRLPPEPALAPLLRKTPYLSPTLMADAVETLAVLRRRYPLVPVGLPDLIADLSDFAVSVPQLVALLRWWLVYQKDPSHPPVTLEQRRGLLGAVTLQAPLVEASLVDPPADSTAGGHVPVPLASYRYFQNPRVVHQGLPVPAETLPLALTRSFGQPDLRAAFGTWEELSLATWVAYVVRDHRSALETSAAAAERCLALVARGFDHLDPGARATVLSLLEGVACVPTQLGHRRPTETYFRNVRLFTDLPIVQLARPAASLDRLLTALGVRTHVNLQLVFDRLDNLNWDHVQLVKYLASVREQLSGPELDKLRQTPLLPREEAGDGSPADKDAAQRNRRYLTSELYAPTEDLRALGLPLLRWPGTWRDSTKESALLAELGLRTAPTLPALLRLAAETNDPSVRQAALRYFIDQYPGRYRRSYRPAEVTVPFLPATYLASKDDGTLAWSVDATSSPDNLFTSVDTLARPDDCYAHPAGQVMGFRVLQTDLRPHAATFGVAAHPPVSLLLNRLAAQPPRDARFARAEFEYLTARQADFGARDWQAVAQLRFIPTPTPAGGVTHRAAAECYFATGGTEARYDMLTYVTFGPVADLFLKACGVQDEPTAVDLARLMVKDPGQFLAACRSRSAGARGGDTPAEAMDQKGYEHYLQVLRQLAVQRTALGRHRDLVQKMRNRPFLLAVRERSVVPPASALNPPDNSPSESTPTLEYRLEYPYNVTLVDDTVLQKTFNPWAAPMEALLEDFYEYLGANWISRQVQETSQPAGTVRRSQRAQALQRLIRERAPLLIYDYQRDQATKLLRSSEWLATRLQVLEVETIHVHRKFAPTQRVQIQPTTACLQRQVPGVDAPRDTWFLLIARLEYSEFDVATVLCRLLFSKTRLNDTLLLETMLATPLDALKRKGFPVDRVLNLKKSVVSGEPPAPRPVPPPVVPSPRTLDKMSASSIAPPPAAPGKGPSPLPSYDEAVGVAALPASQRPLHAQLQTLFPDCDPEYLTKCLREVKGSSGDDAVAQISNRLLDRDYPRRSPGPPTPVSAPGPASGTGSAKGKLPAPPPTAGAGEDETLPSAGPSGTSEGMGSGLFDRLSRRFQSGINELYKGYDKVIPLPPTSMPNQPGPAAGPTAITTTGGDPHGEMSSQPSSNVAPDHDDRLRQSLQSSVQSCVRNTATFPGTTPSAAPPAPEPPRDYTGESHQHYCEVIPAQRLTPWLRVGSFDVYLETGLDPQSVFGSSGSMGPVGPELALLPWAELLADTPAAGNLGALHAMGHVLTVLVEVFGLDARAVHIFYDAQGSTIAFNRGRSLFFNLRFFTQLHHFTMLKDQRQGPAPRAADVYYYWFMVACHELGHNFVTAHDARHEFYMSSFAEQYLRAMVAQLAKLRLV
ncbi:hypothetical protein IWQ60_004808 [Tieghemiomyces parasiticus]|uniref:CUE domain-containing protein n=1 Tax=Tieghemiomyces parasiticus TaxID=78921 RepID=A0A9W8AF95_9FUNG|nr:hypothetical protein IWQ60_004808 [Tieghemiomyces parasiticus]